MCHRTTNYLICLLPLFLPLLHPSPPLLHYLLLQPFLKPSFPPIPASSPPPDSLSRSLLLCSSLPQSHPCLPHSLRTLVETFCLILWPLKNCWSNSAAHPIIADRGRGKGRDEGRKIRSEGVGWNTEWRGARRGYGGRKEYGKLRRWRQISVRMSISWVIVAASQHISCIQHILYAGRVQPETTLCFWRCIHCKLYSSNKTRKQSWFTVNLIKAACLHCTPLRTAKSNLLSIWFTQRSIHLHWRLLGTICGY